MLSSLRELFDALLSPVAGDPHAGERHSLQLATAVLLVEVMRADPEIAETERRTLVEALSQQFALGDDEVQDLLARAMNASREATDFYAFTSRINEACDMGRKLQIIESLWRVAYADGRLDARENHVMRKIADLLYIDQGAYVNAKMRARSAMTPPEPDDSP